MSGASTQKRIGRGYLCRTSTLTLSSTRTESPGERASQRPLQLALAGDASRQGPGRKRQPHAQAVAAGCAAGVTAAR